MKCCYCEARDSESHSYCCPYGKDQTLTGEELEGYKKSIPSVKKIGNIFDLQKENAELQAKLDSIEYLNRQKVHSLIWELLGVVNLQDFFIDENESGEPVDNENTILLDDCITAICNLALPEIDRDKIVELKEIIAEYELNEPDKFSIGEIKEALKSVYGVVSDGSMAILLEKLNENKAQWIKNMEAI